MKILSSFTHPQVVPNLYEFLCSAEHKGIYSEECGKQSSSGAPLTLIVFFFPTMEVNGAPKQPGYKLSSKYLPLCSAEQRNSYRFGTTWGWVNDDRIFIFGWTIPLMLMGGHLPPPPPPAPPPPSSSSRSSSSSLLPLPLPSNTAPDCLPVFAAQLLWTVRLHLWRLDLILVWWLSVVLCSRLPFGVLLVLALWNGRQGLTRMPSFTTD